MHEHDLLAVEQHGAGTAVAGMAADLGASQAEVVAQHIREAARRLGDELVSLPLTLMRSA